MKRRSPGSGSVIEHHDGRRSPWEARYRGRSLYRRTRRDALAALAELQTGAATPRPRGGLTLAAYLETWLSRRAAAGVQASTLTEHYGPSVRRITKGIGHVPLGALTPALVQDFLTALSSAGFQPATVRDTRGVLSRALEEAVDLELVARNVARRTRAPRVRPPSRQRLREQQAHAILAAVAGTWIEGPVTLGLLYGARVSEVLGLRWEDVGATFDIADQRRSMSLDITGVLHIRGQVTREHEYKPRTKSGEPRELPIVAPLVPDILRRARVQQAADRLRAGASYTATEFVFTGPDGLPHDRGAVSRALRRTLVAAGLPPLTFHALRHGAKDLLRSLGVDSDTRRAILGHLDEGTHARYGAVDFEDTRNALTRLGRVLGG